MRDRYSNNASSTRQQNAKYKKSTRAFEVFERSNRKRESKDLQIDNRQQNWRNRSGQSIRSEISERMNMCTKAMKPKEPKRDENENNTRCFSEIQQAIEQITSMKRLTQTKGQSLLVDCCSIVYFSSQFHRDCTNETIAKRKNTAKPNIV